MLCNPRGGEVDELGHRQPSDLCGAERSPRLGAARDGIGARVRVVVGGRTLTRRLDGNLSIAGSGPHGVFVGLGATPRAERVEVRFPSGAVRTVENVPPGRVVVSE